jgi:pimeloyl-ACP methyl ester carboxylesterase
MTDNDSVVGIRLKLPSADVFVRVCGEGRPVVLLHGGGPGTSGDGWVDCMMACAAGLQLFAPDLPGFGDSGPLDSGSEYGNAAFVAATLAMLDALCLPHVTLAGHSMGASVAAAIAARHPERVEKLLLLAPGGAFFGFTDYESPGMTQIARTTLDPSIDNVRALVDLMSSQDAEGRARQVEHRLQRLRRPGILEGQRALLNARSTLDATAIAQRAEMAGRIQSFERPVTLIWGAEEAFNPAVLGDRIRAVLPSHTSYYVIPGAGHNVQYDQPRSVAQLIG